MMSPQCSAFFKLDERARVEKFRGYPVEKQFDLYMCGMEREPPEVSVAYDLARGGPKNTDFLLGKLKAEGYDPDKANIIYIFRAMSVLGNFECRPEVIGQLEQAVRGMGANSFRQNAQESLDQIRKDSCHAPE